jgi:hypothetical protein
MDSTADLEHSLKSQDTGRRNRPSTLHAYRMVMPATSRYARGVSPAVKVTVYGWENLSDRTGVNNQWMAWGATVPINGTDFPSSLVAWNSEDPAVATDTADIEYNLDHKCLTLAAVFGISDDSETGGQAEVDVLSDGTTLYTNTFDVGQKEAKTIALGSPLKLRLETHQTSATANGYGVFGTARVLCTK